MDKKFICFYPYFFSGKILHVELFQNIMIGFLALCFTSSCVYMINDIMDIEKDKNHPEKKNRPLAAGLITKNGAIAIFLCLLVSAITIAIYININLFLIICLYIILNLGYSFGLKSISIIDVTIIAIGFIIRIFAGGIVANVMVSKWLVLMTFLLSLLLALAKRRDDLLIFEKTGNQMRKSLTGYNFDFINAAMIFMASVTTVSYLMYTVSEEVVKRIGNDYVYLTSFPVIVGLLRYLQITLVENNSGSPTKILFNDRVIQVLIIIWLSGFYILLYQK